MMGHVAAYGACTRVWPLCVIMSWYFIVGLVHPHRLLGFLVHILVRLHVVGTCHELTGTHISGPF